MTRTIKQTIINFDNFDGANPYAFLSNFYEEPVFIFGTWWPTGEHAFQAMKTLDMERRRKISNAKSPSVAKFLGRSTNTVLRPDWEAVKYDVMAAIIRAKFTQGTTLAERLLATGDAWLVEGTTWGDRVWGVAGRSVASPGRNWLGTLLMARRAELKAMTKGAPQFMTGDYNEEWVIEHAQERVDWT